MLDYQTAGESHGPGLVTTITGLPAGLELDNDFINGELARRQGGYGRGGRQKIETDRAEYLTGIRRGKTTGSPVTIFIKNKDSRLDDLERTPPVYRPRPGPAALAGSVKWLTPACREALARARAREPAARVAAGAVARCLLNAVGIDGLGFVRQIHTARTGAQITPSNWKQMRDARDASDTYCPDPEVSERQREAIRQAKIDKDTAGGIVEAHYFNLPIGLGSSMDWRTKLDSRIGAAVMGIQAFKGVEIGMGFECASRRGSEVHDPIQFDASRTDEPSLGFTRTRNNAGGLEGGMTNGSPLVVKGVMKPIATLLQGLPSVNLQTKQPEQSQYERSDVSAVSAASVVMEHVIGFELARALVEKFAGDSMTELTEAYAKYLEIARSLPLDPPETTLA